MSIIETLTNITEKISLDNEQAIKIKVQGFLYKNSEEIFRKSTIPEIAENYNNEELASLSLIADKYEVLFENSLGILTSSHVEINDRKCIACQRCTRFCPSNALEKIGVDLVLHENKCIKCGNCIGNCPFLALKAVEKGLGIYIKNSSSTIPYILPKLYKIDDIESVIGNILDFYKTNKNCDEALFDVIENIGFETLLKYLN